MRVVANRAAFAQRGVLEDERPGLLAMTLAAGFVLARHSQASSGLQDVHPMRIMALDAIHLSFKDRMMLGKVELRARFLMALETGFGVLARIQDKFLRTAATGHRDVLAARAVAGLTTVLPGHFGRFQV